MITKLTPRGMLVKWLAHMTGMHINSVKHHWLVGHIPWPTHPLYEGCEDKERYYFPEEVEDIVKFFLTREMWARMGSPLELTTTNNN